ncbi:GNAT family N-acetyltransferase [Dyella mobilis]|uniref:GNAT family N-acetyltransferase n=1 Tax=Dyella mobilis TaxID=1849582 RepID=UPI0024E14F58|nr:GNAT family N-acetyltransferase [Dyella mobilis]
MITPRITTATVRLATTADLPPLRELFFASRRQAFAWQPADSFRIDDFDQQTHGELLLVAEETPARLIGMISVWEPDQFIHHLHVDPSSFRRGVGSALLQALPGWPKTRYRLKCLCANTPALAFYRALGFTEAGSGATDEGEYLLLESTGAG